MDSERSNVMRGTQCSFAISARTSFAKAVSLAP
jgi:hypothetical protein